MNDLIMKHSGKQVLREKSYLLCKIYFIPSLGFLNTEEMYIPFDFT